MRTDAEVLAAIDAAFGVIERPQHFTDYAHCCECAEHDELLRSRSRDTLLLEDIGNPGWDPICFCCPEGIAYYFPALARFALAPETEHGWYGDQFVFHLSTGFKGNRFYRWCSSAQRAAITRLLAHIIETRAALLDAYALSDDYLRCHELWSAVQE